MLCRLKHALDTNKNHFRGRSNQICLNKYKHINVQTLQSHIQDSVENKEAHEETQGQDNHKSRKASAPGFAAEIKGLVCP